MRPLASGKALQADSLCLPSRRGGQPSNSSTPARSERHGTASLMPPEPRVSRYYGRHHDYSPIAV